MGGDGGTGVWVEAVTPVPVTGVLIIVGAPAPPAIVAHVGDEEVSEVSGPVSSVFESINLRYEGAHALGGRVHVVQTPPIVVEAGSGPPVLSHSPCGITSIVLEVLVLGPSIGHQGVTREFTNTT